MLNSKSQAGTEVETSTQAEVSTSSPNNAKPLVVCSQSKNCNCIYCQENDEDTKNLIDNLIYALIVSLAINIALIFF